jgi:hypothetical protein
MYHAESKMSASARGKQRRGEMFSFSSAIQLFFRVKKPEKVVGPQTTQRLEPFI